MGNTTSLNIVHDNYTGRAAFPCYLKLGPSDAIKLSRTVDQKGIGGGHSNEWTVLYNVNNVTRSMSLAIEDGKDSNVNIIRFRHIEYSFQGLYGRRCFLPININIRKTETNFLELDSFTGRDCTCQIHKTGDTSTTVLSHTLRGRSGGLVALELKKNSGYDKYNEATVTDYFADCREKNIGFSLVAKVCISNGKLDINVEGLEQHPASGLFYMIDEFNRSGKWNPTMCPHCVPKPLLCISPQNKREVSNGGSFVGNQNGNYIENLWVLNIKYGQFDSEDNNSVPISRRSWQNGGGVPTYPLSRPGRGD